MPGILIIGVGPGIGVSVARRFATEGLSVGVVARSQTTIDAALAALDDLPVATLGMIANAGDSASLDAALDQFIEQFDLPDVVVYNAAIVQSDAIGELSVAQHLEAWSVNVIGAITAAARLLPAMAARRRGTFLLTGGMPVPSADYTSLSLGKAGVRALTEMLAVKYAPEMVHVATVTVGGAVVANTPLNADDIADEYWRLHTQPAGSWEREVVFEGRPAAR